MTKKTSNKKSPRKGSSILSTLLIIICLAVMAYAGYRLVSLFLEYKAGQDEYKDLQGFTSSEDTGVDSSATDSTSGADIASQDIPSGTLLYSETPNTWPDGLKDPISVDFVSLRSINQDVVGWIYIEPLGISYPVAHGTDNDYYLHHTFKKTYLFSGSIFMDAQNIGDFTDANTILYGHNMKDGSMFAGLKKYTSQELYKENPYIWVLTPQYNYAYRIFSLQTVSPDSDIYTLFTETIDQTFLDWANKMYSQSSVSLDKPNFAGNSRVLTLSTCTSDGSNRTVVQAALCAITKP